MADDNIYPDQSGGLYDLKYAQLRILASDVRRNFSQGQGQTTGGGTGPSEGGDPDPIPPGSSGCERVYKANLNQTGTDDPVASVFRNSIGTITWARSGEGVYIGTSAGLFPAGLTWWDITNPFIEGMDLGAGYIEVRASVVDENTIVVVTRNVSPDGANRDDLLSNVSLEIWTYCEEFGASCAPVVAPTFGDGGLPIGGVGVFYLSQYILTGNAPFDLTVTSKPAWMSISIEDGNILTFTGTPDETEDETPVIFTITNCEGENTTGEITTTITVVEMGDFTIEHTTLFEGDVSPTMQFAGFNTTTPSASYIDWGDGTLEEIVDGNMNLSHDYLGAGTYHQVLYFSSNYTILTFSNFIGSPAEFKCMAFTHSSNFTNFVSSLYLVHIMDFAACFPPSYTNKTALNFVGHTDNIDTSADLTGMSSTIDNLTIENFPELLTISGIASTVNGLLAISNPKLTGLNAGGTLPTCGNLSIQGAGISTLVLGTLNLSGAVEVIISSCGQTTSQVNAIAVATDANGLLNGLLIVTQNSTAPPSGAGAAAIVSLAGKGWTTITDV